jgi:SAM-dependent methyltransferase
MFISKFIYFLKWQDKKLVGVSIHMMKILGRSPKPIHPKHLYDMNRNNYWDNYDFVNKRFLDIGSGNGSELMTAIKRGAQKAIGLEIDDQAIDLALLRLADYKDKFEIHKTDLEDFDFCDKKKFDYINFTNVLEHIVNRQPLLKGLGDLLTDDGVMLISIPNKDTKWKKLQRKYGIDSRDDIDHKIEYDVQGLKDEISSAGLKIGELHPIVISGPINGIIALTSIFSPRLYVKLQSLKREWVQCRLDESIGWIFFVTK